MSNRSRGKRSLSLMMCLNSLLFLSVASLASLCCYHGSVLRSNSKSAVQKIKQRNVVDYTIMVLPAEDESYFQRDIEDVNGHLAMYHSSEIHKGRKPLLEVGGDDNNKPVPQGNNINNKEAYVISSDTVIVQRNNDVHRKYTPAIKPSSNTNYDDNTDFESKKQEGKMGSYDGSSYDDKSSNSKKRLPGAIIIGVKKAGTRALLEFLKMHPDIKAPGPEPHFFDKNYEKGYDWYRNQMPNTLPGQLTMEKTPSYFITKDVPARVYNMSKDTKLLVVVRDPVVRAISDYTQGILRKPDLKPFEKMAFLDNTTETVNMSWAAIKIGMYIKHLEKWLKYFPLKQIHFVDGEKLITQPAKQLYKVQQFLAIKPVITEANFSFNSTKGFPCLVKPQSKGKPHCLGNTKGRTHPKVSEKATLRLKQFYKPFNEKLYSILNHDFEW